MNKDTLPDRSISQLKQERDHWKKSPRSEARTYAINHLNEAIKYKQHLYGTACQFIQGYQWGKSLRKQS